MALDERARESVRKAVHVPAGLVPAVFVVLFGYLGSVALAAYLAAYLGLGGVLAVRLHVRLPIVYAGIASTWRGHERFPVAAFEFLVAILVVGVVFPLPVFLAAVALLGVGDGAAAVVGLRWGTRPLPWNPRKTWQGLWAGMLLGAPAAAVMFVAGARVERMLAGGTLLAGDGTVNLALFAAVGTAGVFFGARAACRLGLATRHATAGVHETLMVVAAAALPALVVLRGPPGWFHAPIFTWDVPVAVGVGLVLTVAPWVMLLESRLRRHDNIILPLAAAAAVWAAGVWLTR